MAPASRCVARGQAPGCAEAHSGAATPARAAAPAGDRRAAVDWLDHATTASSPTPGITSSWSRRSPAWLRRHVRPRRLQRGRDGPGSCFCCVTVTLDTDGDCHRPAARPQAHIADSGALPVPVGDRPRRAQIARFGACIMSPSSAAASCSVGGMFIGDGSRRLASRSADPLRIRLWREREPVNGFRASPQAVRPEVIIRWMVPRTRRTSRSSRRRASATGVSPGRRRGMPAGTRRGRCGRARGAG
jgi:hypothetical protein